MLNIRKLRKEKDLKQIDLASKLGIRSNTLSQYETGDRNQSVEMLSKIAKVLGCTVDDLINDTNKKEKEE